ncbi:MAG: SurA N-terminal domain-containing protein [Hyphomicrobiaceae bacterium]
MLETLRRGAAKFVVFALLSILILSFAIWGIGDIIRRGTQGPIATVGDREISAQEFTTALQNRRAALQRQINRPITPEQSRALGIDASVLAELINGEAAASYAKSLGVRLSDRTIAEEIRQDPAFQGPGKTFNRAVFDERIRQAGFSEQRYFEERRASELRAQVTESLLGGISAPEEFVTIAHRYREETRTVSFIKLDPAKLAKIADPDEAALKTFYEEQKGQFVVPERRKIAVLILTPEALAERSKVTDEEVKAYWESTRSSWDLPELRRIQQIAFKTKTEAEGEVKALRDGKSFLMAALEANGAGGRLDQGLVARREISDPNYAEAAFTLPLNKVSDPIEVRGGWMVLRVTEIEPAHTRTYDEVKDAVRQSMEDTKRREIAGKLHDEIEDRRGASTDNEKLKKIAADMKLKLVEATVDANGNGPDGKPAFVHPDAQTILASAFEGDKITPREALQLSNGSEAWVEVIDVTPAKTKPLEDVKAEVAKLWRERETQKALAEKAKTLADRVKAGEQLAAIAKDAGATVESSKPFKRAEPPAGLSPGAARLAFTLAKGGAASAATGDGKGRLVFVVTDIKVPEAPSKEAAEALKRQITSDLQRDAIQTFVNAVRKLQKVNVNEAVYRRAVGLDQPQ